MVKLSGLNCTVLVYSVELKHFLYILFYFLLFSFFNRERNELLTICAYVGALVAVRRKYFSIVPALFKHTK